MARTALIVKVNRRKRVAELRRSKGLKVKFQTRIHNRCKLCGRIHGYMRKFGMCRICFRLLAREGKLMGVKKCSW